VKTELEGIYAFGRYLKARSSVYQPTSGLTQAQWNILVQVDPDGDRIGNLDEFRNGKNPRLANSLSMSGADTDGDGFSLNAVKQ
jgi:hypothetical protein